MANDNSLVHWGHLKHNDTRMWERVKALVQDIEPPPEVDAQSLTVADIDKLCV